MLICTMGTPISFRTRARVIARRYQRVQAVDRLGRLMECSVFDESQDRAEIDHILGVCAGQFSVAISARLDHLLRTRGKVAEVEWPTVAAALHVSRIGYVTPRYARTRRGSTSIYAVEAGGCGKDFGAAAHIDILR